MDDAHGRRDVFVLLELRSNLVLAPHEEDFDRGVLAGYVGRYQVADGRELRVALGDEGLAYSMDEIEWIPLLPETQDRFFVESEDERYTFVLGGDGVVVRLDVLAEGQTFPLSPIVD